MKKILFLSIFFLVTVTTGCAQDTDILREAVVEANYCEQDDDCMSLGSVCPIGCNIYVHKDEADRVNGLITGYESSCDYRCNVCSKATCVNNVCEKAC